MRKNLTGAGKAKWQASVREWSFEQSQIDHWDQALARRSQILVAQEDDVRQIYETWQVTREAGKQQAFPKVALQKIAEVLREADAVRRLIRDGMAKLLNLQICFYLYDR